MLKAFKLALVAALLVPAFASANDVDTSSELTARTSCRARAVDRYYCPVSGGTWWQGPYWDNGCSVKCQTGQKAVCQEAGCESGSGDAIASACYCK